MPANGAVERGKTVKLLVPLRFAHNRPRHDRDDVSMTLAGYADELATFLPNALRVPRGCEVRETSSGPTPRRVEGGRPGLCKASLDATRRAG